MTPQEKELVEDLFDRLAKLEATPRDADAERTIAEATRRAPHAVYALVQTALVQDEALKRANARIEELQAQAGGDEPQRPAGFLDSMREAFGGRTARGSVPGVRQQSAQPPGPQTPPPGYSAPMAPPGYAGAAPYGAGSSFLGTAASTAAGVIGGALLLDGIRSMFGHNFGSANASPFDDVRSEQMSPWSSDAGRAGDSAFADAGGRAGDNSNDSVRNADDSFQNADDSFQNADDDDAFGNDFGGDDSGSYDV